MSRWRRTPVGDLVRRQERRPREAQRQAGLDAAGGLDLLGARGQLRALVHARQGGRYGNVRAAAGREEDGSQTVTIRLPRPDLPVDRVVLGRLGLGLELGHHVRRDALRLGRQKRLERERLLGRRGRRAVGRLGREEDRERLRLRGRRLARRLSAGQIASRLSCPRSFARVGDPAVAALALVAAGLARQIERERRARCGTSGCR